jgi:putative membrane protein insertion efficiency factor
MTSRTRRAAGLLIVLSLAGGALDLRRPPSEQWSTRVALLAVRAYQRTVSPLMPRVGVQCRFTPTCSRYAEAVLAAHGVPRGAWLALKRVARCGPWTPAGTVDPPPTNPRAGVTARAGRPAAARISP